MPTSPSYTVQYLHTPNILYPRLGFPADRNDIDHHEAITVIIKDFTTSLIILLYYLLSITHGHNLKAHNKIVHVVNIADSTSSPSISLYHLSSVTYDHNLKPHYKIARRIFQSS